LTLHFEGIADDAKDDDQVTFELDTSMAEDPIQTHPFFDTLKTRYAWDAAKEQFAETLPEASGQQTALSGSGKKPKKNPMFGVDNWLVVGAVFRKTYAARTIPSTILRGIGTIVDKPPGIEQFKIDAPASMQIALRGSSGLALPRHAFPARRRVRLREMPDGTTITFDGDGADFVHPFHRVGCRGLPEALRQTRRSVLRQPRTGTADHAANWRIVSAGVNRVSGPDGVGSNPKRA
jgi:hypothetical protein